MTYTLAQLRGFADAAARDDRHRIADTAEAAHAATRGAIAAAFGSEQGLAAFHHYLDHLRR